MKENVTVKGGVVMSCISHNTRHATQDFDIDFIRYSISNEVNINTYGQIDELKQQDYHVNESIFVLKM